MVEMDRRIENLENEKRMNNIPQGLKIEKKDQWLLDKEEGTLKETSMETETILPQQTRENEISGKLRIATWNVRMVYDKEKLEELISQIKEYKYDVVALQETKQEGKKNIETDDYILMTSGGKSRRLGTGFIIAKKLTLLEFKEISERMCRIRLRGQYQEISIINIHAPTEKAKVAEKEKFYSKLDEEYEKIPKDDIKLVIGDANAKIGKENIFRPTIGKHSKHESTNENGYFLIDFASEKGMIIKSTHFEKKEIHKGTWRLPNGTDINQIDHVLIEGHDKNLITDVQSYRGPNVNSDHFLVGLHMKQDVPRDRSGRELKCKHNHATLKKEEDIGNTKKLSEKCETVKIQKDIEKLWTAVKNQVVGEASRKENEWVDTEFEKELENKKAREKAEELVGEEQEILEMWKNHFEKQLNGIDHYDAEEEENPPTLTEIEEIIKKLKNTKSSGQDMVTPELLKYGGEVLIKLIKGLIDEIWTQEQMPKSWSKALLNLGYKVLVTAIKNKIILKTESGMGEYQNGLRNGRSIMDQIFTIREIQDGSQEQKLETFVAFVNFQQTYGSVLYEAMVELGVQGKLLRLIKMILQRTTGRAGVEAQQTEKFDVKNGLRQGKSLLPLLFNLALEYVVRKAKLNRNGSIYGKKEHQILAFANDIVILTRSEEELSKKIVQLEQAAQPIGLNINEQKTKYMKWSNNKFEKGEIRVQTASGNTYNFEKVDTFKYLGTNIYRKPEMKREIQHRLIQGNRVIFELKSILNDEKISKNLKTQIYKSIIRPIVTFGSEIWTILGTTEKNLLGVWERKMLRKIYGGEKQVNGTSKRRSDRELMELFEEPSIIAIVKRQRLRWLGHILRMSPNRVPRKIWDYELSIPRKRGRPKNTWKNEVLRDLKTSEINDWKTRAMDKSEWRRTIHEAMDRLDL